MKVVVKKAQNQFDQNLPFVLYKKPNNTTVIALFQKNDSVFEVKDFTEKGFVFASFDGSIKVLIPENQSEKQEAAIDKEEFLPNESSLELPNGIEKNNFIALVAKGIEAIENNEFKKVVLSRKESIVLANFDVIAAFEKLVQLYPTTFVYCFFHPKVGTWLGATPEQLLQSNDRIVKTIALAGTQKNIGSDEVVWQQKEIDEQQFVTDFIVDSLNTVATNVLVSEPYSLKAGSIWHIKTDISGIINSERSLQDVIELLHPTPAVCGLPKDKAKAFILENEKYKRTFYTGFLGEINASGLSNVLNSDLFVNLRCMEICHSNANLYMGCGITKDSVAEKEWEESVNKSGTMKKILE